MRRTELDMYVGRRVGCLVGEGREGEQAEALDNGCAPVAKKVRMFHPHVWTFGLSTERMVRMSRKRYFFWIWLGVEAICSEE